MQQPQLIQPVTVERIGQRNDTVVADVAVGQDQGLEARDLTFRNRLGDCPHPVVANLAAREAQVQAQRGALAKLTLSGGQTTAKLAAKTLLTLMRA